MKKDRDDLYILILRYGKENLTDGLRIQDMVDHLNKHTDGKIKYTPNSIIFYEYWLQIFFNHDNETQYNASSQAFYFLKPEKYLALLEYDNMFASRKEARLAIRIAITSIIITLIISIISIYK